MGEEVHLFRQGTTLVSFVISLSEVEHCKREKERESVCVCVHSFQRYAHDSFERMIEIWREYAFMTLLNECA